MKRAVTRRGTASRSIISYAKSHCLTLKEAMQSKSRSTHLVLCPLLGVFAAALLEEHLTDFMPVIDYYSMQQAKMLMLLRSISPQI